MLLYPQFFVQIIIIIEHILFTLKFYYICAKVFVKLNVFIAVVQNVFKTKKTDFMRYLNFYFKGKGKKHVRSCKKIA